MVPPVGSSTDQITDWFTIPLTAAPNWTSWPGATTAVEGFTATAMAGGTAVEVQAESPARKASPAAPRVFGSMRGLYPDWPPRAAASWGSRTAYRSRWTGTAAPAASPRRTTAPVCSCSSEGRPAATSRCMEAVASAGSSS